MQTDATAPRAERAGLVSFDLDTIIPPCDLGPRPSLLPFPSAEGDGEAMGMNTLVCGGGPPRGENGPHRLGKVYINEDPVPPPPPPRGLSVFLPPPATGTVVIQMPVNSVSFGNITLTVEGDITPPDTAMPPGIDEAWWREQTTDFKQGFNASLSEICDNTTWIFDQGCRSAIAPLLRNTVTTARQRVQSFVGTRPNFRTTTWTQLVHTAAFYACEITAMVDTAFNTRRQMELGEEMPFQRREVGYKLALGEIATSIQGRPWETGRIFKKISTFADWGYEKRSLSPPQSCASIVDSASRNNHFSGFHEMWTPPWQNPPEPGGGGGGGGGCSHWLQCGEIPERAPLRTKTAARVGG
jgi:hypothetical protein